MNVVILGEVARFGKKCKKCYFVLNPIFYCKMKNEISYSRVATRFLISCIDLDSGVRHHQLLAAIQQTHPNQGGVSSRAIKRTHVLEDRAGKAGKNDDKRIGLG